MSYELYDMRYVNTINHKTVSYMIGLHSMLQSVMKTVCTNVCTVQNFSWTIVYNIAIGLATVYSTFTQ